VRPLPAIAAAATLLLLACAAGAQARGIGGLIADIPTGGHVHTTSGARAASLDYGGGPVLHANRTHLIFWQPTGSGLTFDSGYESLIERFLAGVAADSHRPTNVYSLTGQYSDAQGPAVYNSTYAGAVIATDPLPASDCTEPSTGPGWSACLIDQDLQNEIQNVVSADHLPTGADDVYFLVTPSGLGDCIDSTSSSCALGGSGTGYCGYHSQTSGGLLYAVIPYNAVPGHCQSNNPRPNGSTADPAISTISHEHNEVITYPQTDAWIDGAGNENGDLCITNFGPILGGSAGSAWNEVIGGGHYFLQEEWSNDDTSCQARDESNPVSFSVPARLTAGRLAAFLARASDPDGGIAAYTWFWGDGGSGRHRLGAHAFRRAGSYRVVLRTTDSAGNWAFYTRTVRVTARLSRGRQHRARR
jgi:hypothetical protein